MHLGKNYSPIAFAKLDVYCFECDIVMSYCVCVNGASLDCYTKKKGLLHFHIAFTFFRKPKAILLGNDADLFKELMNHQGACF